MSHTVLCIVLTALQIVIPIKNVVVLKQHFNCRSSLINLLYRNIANITLNLNCGINNEVKGSFPRYHELVVIHVILLNKVQNIKSFRNNMLKPMQTVMSKLRTNYFKILSPPLFVLPFVLSINLMKFIISWLVIVFFVFFVAVLLSVVLLICQCCCQRSIFTRYTAVGLYLCT